MAQREQVNDVVLPDGFRPHLLIVRAEFNRDITQAQLEHATKWCDAHGVAYDVRSVAGAYEIPWMLQHMLGKKHYDGAVALGCLINGATPHFEVIMHSVAQAIQDVQRTTNIPIGFGILTTLTREQAIERQVIGKDATRAVIYSLMQARAL